MRSVLNKEMLEISIRKINMYRRNEQVLFNDFKKKFSNLNSSYSSSNKGSLANLEGLLYNKFKSVVSNHGQEVVVLNKNIGNYEATKVKVENMFKDMDGGMDA